ncbi:preprotein translocase subunit SecG [Rhodopila sp.]|uniref:preprotein translocase subunit SecG n=1 Tax=Rhodopila sp. TaxID=2480087 RepID=UPI0038D0C635
MNTVLLIIHLFVTLALIGVVLIQRSEGGGLGIGSSQGMGAFMSGRGTANLLTRTTAVLATIFMALSLTLALLNRGTVGAGRSLFDTAPVTAPAPASPPASPLPSAPVGTGPEAPGAAAPVSPTPAPTTPAPTTPAPTGSAPTGSAPTGLAPAAPAPAASAPASSEPAKPAEPKVPSAPTN